MVGNGHIDPSGKGLAEDAKGNWKKKKKKKKSFLKHFHKEK